MSDCWGARLARALAATVLGVAINFATDNADNMAAWALVAAATVTVALLPGRTQGSGQSVSLRGRGNRARQRSKGDSSQNIKIAGEDNEALQEDL